jgi:L,D-transpeptidase ErfK/SrfK
MTQPLAMTILMMVAAGAAAAEGGERRVVVSLADRKVALVEDGVVVKVYPIAVGKPRTPSPTGEFRIVNRIPRPTYYAPGVVIRPGPSNPLGTRWIGLDRKGYGLHGTNVPRSIGHAASHGCIRLRNHDVEDLFERISEGDVVEFYGERNERVQQLFDPPAAAEPVAEKSVERTAE